MKTILETFKNSFYNPAFYRNIAEVSWKGAFRTYFKFTFFLSIVFAIVSGILLVPQGVSFVRESAPTLVKKYFPAELVVTVKGGEASVNVPVPYIIPMNPGADSAFKDTTLKNVIVIDTEHDFNQKMFDEYQTFALLTKHELVTQSTSGQLAIQQLRVTPSMTISQDSLLGWVEKIRSSLVYVVPLGLIATVFITFLGFTLYLIPLFLFALIPFFLAWIKKNPLSYGNAYKMSLYAILPGLVLKDILNAAGFFVVPASLNLLMFLLVIALNMRDIEQPTLFTPEQK